MSPVASGEAAIRGRATLTGCMWPGRADTRTPATLVLNPRAGAIARLPMGAQGVIEAARTHFALMQDPAPELPIGAQIARALAPAPEVVLVAGGDGTVAAVAEQLVGEPSMLGVIPGGTMNRLAARLGLPRDPIEAIEALAGAEPVLLPTGSVNGRLFLYQAVLGRPARLARFREMQRDGQSGWWPLLVAGLRAAARPLGRRLDVAVPPAFRTDAVAAVVTVPEPHLADGRLRIEAVQRTSLAAGARQVVLWLTGRLGDSPDVLCADAPHAAIRARRRRIRLMLDGEMVLMENPLRIRLVRGALTLLRPPRPPDAA